MEILKPFTCFYTNEFELCLLYTHSLLSMLDQGHNYKITLSVTIFASSYQQQTCEKSLLNNVSRSLSTVLAVQTKDLSFISCYQPLAHRHSEPWTRRIVKIAYETDKKRGPQY